MVDSLDRAIPRLEAITPSMTILEIKKQIMKHYRHIYEEEFDFEATDIDSKINEACELYIRDNIQETHVKTKKGSSTTKPACEYCKAKHSAGEHMCDIKINEVDGNTMESATKVTLEQIIAMQEQ